MKKHNFMLMLLLIMITPCLMAQKKEISQARSYIKSGKSLDKAEQLMKDLLQKNPENKENTKIYLLWFQAVKKQYEAGNEKLYLKQKYDTASMYVQAKKMFDILMMLDSVDAKPNEKGKIKAQYRKKHANELDTYRPNLFYGGSFFLNKNDYQKAYDMYETYILTAEHPMFADMKYLDKDTMLFKAAYWSTYCAYMLKKPELVLKHSSMALGDSNHTLYVMQYMAEAHKMMGDDAKYKEVLNKGFEMAPAFGYFFPRLMDYYTASEDFNSALALADKAIETDNKNILFLYAKSTTLLDMGRYQECITVCDSIIALNDSVSGAYYNAGISYMRLTASIDQTVEYKKMIKANYEKALPYLEKYRQLEPKDSDKWAMPLYKIYLNLNMGKQFEEIDKILNK